MTVSAILDAADWPELFLAVEGEVMFPSQTRVGYDCESCRRESAPTLDQVMLARTVSPFADRLFTEPSASAPDVLGIPVSAREYVWQQLASFCEARGLHLVFPDGSHKAFRPVV